MSLEVTVTHLSGPRQNEVETFTSLPVRIGRDDSCQVRFDPERDVQVSAQHAELREVGQGSLTLHDLDSKNGVWLNGSKVVEPTAVPNHAVIEIGLNGPRLRIQYEDQAGGISFSSMRKGGEEPPRRSRRLADTEEVLRVYKPDSDEGAVGAKFQLSEHALLIGLGGLALLVLILWLVFGA